MCTCVSPHHATHPYLIGWNLLPDHMKPDHLKAHPLKPEEQKEQVKKEVASSSSSIPGGGGGAPVSPLLLGEKAKGVWPHSPNGSVSSLSSQGSSSGTLHLDYREM